MTSIKIPVAMKLLRFTTDTMYQINKNSLLRLPRTFYTFSWKKSRYSTVTEEKKNGGDAPLQEPTVAEEKKNGEDAPLQEPTVAGKKWKNEIELLNKEIVELKEIKNTLDDKYKRALADGENLRIRLTKQIEDAKLFGIQGFCKDLLDVADVLGKATESVPKSELTDKNPHLKTLYEGLIMTEAQLHKVFKKHGLVSLNPINEKFDPNQHEALFQQEVEGKKPGTVVVVSKIGYKLHERIVRPALVGVAKG